MTLRKQSRWLSLACFLLSSCLSDDTFIKPIEPLFQASAAAVMFHEKNNRWPETPAELGVFAKANGIPFDHTQFSKIRFVEGPDKKVTIEFELATTPSCKGGSGTVTLDVHDRPADQESKAGG